MIHGAPFALSVFFYGSQNRQRLLLYTSLTDLVFITVVESVYSAVRTESLYKADRFGFCNRGGKCLQRGTD